MNNYKILVVIGEDISFNIAGKSQLAKLADLENEEFLNRIYRIQFGKPPSIEVFDRVLLAIQKRPEISLRFYGDYSENLIDWNKLFDVQKLQIDLWNIISLKEVGKLVNLRELGITKNVSSNVSLSIIEPLNNLKVLYTSVSKGIESINSLKELNKISLREIRNNDLDFLAGLDKLKTLYISLGSYTDFSGLIKINNLELLDIHQVRGFNDDIAENILANCNSLRALKLENLTRITNLTFTKSLKNLKYLSMDGVQNLKTFNPLLENKSVETLSGYKCQPIDKSLIGLKEIKNIMLGDSYNMVEINKFLMDSRAENINIRGKILRGSSQVYNPFYP